MCGIGGIRRFGGPPIEEYQIRGLLLSLRNRGSDATGVAVANDDGIHVYKKDDQAWKFVSDPGYDEFMSRTLPTAWIALVHTRAATQGSSRKNENNHPVYAGVSAVVHNGIIHNDGTLFTGNEYERKAEVDSDILRAMADKHGLTKKAIRQFDRLTGSVAAAIIHPDHKGEFMLLRSGSPLVLASTQDQLIWASTKEAIHQAMRPWVARWGLWFQETKPSVGWLPMEDDRAWLFGPEGLQWFDNFKACVRYFQPTYTRKDWKEKQQRLNAQVEEKKVIGTPTEENFLDGIKFVICPKVGCRMRVEIPDHLMQLELKNLKCRACGTNLAKAAEKA